MDAVFEIHVECWSDALHICDRGHDNTEEVLWLDNILRKYKVRPVWYLLKDYQERFPSFFNRLLHDQKVLSHGVHHYYDEKADRSPYFNQEGLPLPPSGGFFFRIMPMWYLKWAIKKSGIFWIHPHDLDENHPKLKNPIMDFKRRVGLKGAKKKLEKLLKEVEFA